MNYSIDEINEIRYSAFYNAIPLKAAQEARDDRWWFQHDAMTLAAMKLSIWELGSYAAFLFDAYPDIIKKVNLDWYTEKVNNQLYVSFYMYINDKQVDEEGVVLPDIDLLEEDNNIISNVYSSASEVIGSQILDKIGEVIDAFKKPMFSKNDALTIISTYAGDIQAQIQEHILTSNTLPARNIKQGPRL